MRGRGGGGKRTNPLHESSDSAAVLTATPYNDLLRTNSGAKLLTIKKYQIHDYVTKDLLKRYTIAMTIIAALVSGLRTDKNTEQLNHLRHPIAWICTALCNIQTLNVHGRIWSGLKCKLIPLSCSSSLKPCHQHLLFVCINMMQLQIYLF